MSYKTRRQSKSRKPRLKSRKRRQRSKSPVSYKQLSQQSQTIPMYKRPTITIQEYENIDSPRQPKLDKLNPYYPCLIDNHVKN